MEYNEILAKISNGISINDETSSIDKQNRQLRLSLESKKNNIALFFGMPQKTNTKTNLDFFEYCNSLIEEINVGNDKRNDNIKYYEQFFIDLANSHINSIRDNDDIDDNVDEEKINNLICIRLPNLYNIDEFSNEEIITMYDNINFTSEGFIKDIKKQSLVNFFIPIISQIQFLIIRNEWLFFKNVSKLTNTKKSMKRKQNIEFNTFQKNVREITDEYLENIRKLYRDQIEELNDEKNKKSINSDAKFKEKTYIYLGEEVTADELNVKKLNEFKEFCKEKKLYEIDTLKGLSEKSRVKDIFEKVFHYLDENYYDDIDDFMLANNSKKRYIYSLIDSIHPTNNIFTSPFEYKSEKNSSRIYYIETNYSKRSGFDLAMQLLAYYTKENTKTTDIKN